MIHDGPWETLSGWLPVTVTTAFVVVDTTSAFMCNGKCWVCLAYACVRVRVLVAQSGLVRFWCT